MPFVTLRDSIEIHYHIVGDSGPWVVAVSSARFSHEDMLPLARHLAGLGHRVLVHDRRNCGQSSLSFDFEVSEDQIWADDLVQLIELLGIDDAIVVGLSRGTRVAVLLGAQHPASTGALVLWGLSGGERTKQFLDHYYYGKYLKACAHGGMDAVAALDHWAAVAGARPENLDVLHAVSPADFAATTERWRRSYLDAGSSDDLLGVRDDHLRSLSMPVAIVPYYDRGHPMCAWKRAEGLVPNVRVFDFDPSRHGDVKRTVDDTEVVARLMAGFIADVAPVAACDPSATFAARRPSPRRWWSRRSS
jgi:pimeloyl-ACP methyl ester carboxylesterase